MSNVAASVEIKCTEEAKNMNFDVLFINGFADSDSRLPGIEQNRMCEIVSRDLAGHNHEIVRFFAVLRGFQSICKLAIQPYFVFPLQATSCLIRQLFALSKRGIKGPPAAGGPQIIKLFSL